MLNNKQVKKISQRPKYSMYNMEIKARKKYSAAILKKRNRKYLHIAGTGKKNLKLTTKHSYSQSSK